MEAAEQSNTADTWQMARIARIGGSCNGLHESTLLTSGIAVKGRVSAWWTRFARKAREQCNPLQFIGKTYTVFLAADSEDALHEPAQFLYSHGRRDAGDEPSFRRAAVTAARCRPQIHTAAHW